MEKINEQDLPLDQLKFYHLENLTTYPWWEKVLRGGKSPKISVQFTDALGIEHVAAGRFRFAKNENSDGYDIKIEHVQSFLNLKKEFWGYNFTKAQQKKLFTDAELGEVLTLNVAGKQISALVGVDTELNKLAFMPLNAIFIPDKVKGVSISELDKFIMRRGGEVYKEDFVFSKEKPEPKASIMYFSAGLDKICFREPTPERLQQLLQNNKSLIENFTQSKMNENIKKNLNEATADLNQTDKKRAAGKKNGKKI